jgi:hypothetical protein
MPAFAEQLYPLLKEAAQRPQKAAMAPDPANFSF